MFPGKIFSARLNASLYGLLLLVTPFLMLQNYLQDAVGLLSGWSYRIGGLKIPFVLTAALVFILALIILYRKRFTWKKASIWMIILLMWIIGQQTSDYYLNKPFYELQHNWHFIAYGIFAFLAYQVFAPKHSNPARIITSVYLMAFSISAFDEAMQIMLSSRVFDVSDIAKDMWGVLMGLLFVFFIYRNDHFYKGWKFREQRIRDYTKNPLAILALLLIFTYILLAVSSLLSDEKFVLNVVFTTLLIFLPVFLIVHATRTRSGRITMSVLAGIVAIIMGISFAGNFHRNINSWQKGLTVYRGIPIPYFDVMIFENGGFRLVDKKVHFNQSDQMLFFDKASNILLIGSGEEKRTRMGFPEDLESQFVYNNKQGRALQVIILPTREACRVFNRLKREKKTVTFVIHNTR